MHGIEPQYQAIRTIDIEHGRDVRAGPTRSRCARVAIIGADVAEQLFGTRDSLGETRHAERHAVHGRRQDPEEGPGQQLQRARQRQGLRAVRGDGARLPARRRRRRARCRTSSSRRSRGWSTQLPRVLDSRTGRIEDIDWPLERERPRACWRRRHGFDPERPQRDRDVGHVAPDADVRPDDRAHEAVLHASSAS